ncbi:peptidase [Streptomyces alfalfae]|uniref:Peptidase n=1 Tax=Streptomyces alfalfae TaxID=1642299 RepID=A0ABN4VF59_9ACTN|nr:serine hydrolase domain-containing protein [Streptomyces alfalfae]APY84998.1 peptidase [Streptomyces alfalfae]AYA15335.1 class A beta-lactamase-related serine hydrolase [Streptomyces fradiae]RXX48017.1 peptidase [Streptomyces alfalfae]RZN05406.1 class A beta-lactamase-related serine hydrolase [Streptomyces alfalfae]
MKRRAARTALLALAVTGALGAATLTPAAQAAERGPGHTATARALNDLIDKGGQPGVAALARDGAATWFGAAGHADTATGRARSAGDHFRGASITKTFIATVLLQLEAEGRLDLDDTVEKWLPGLVRGNGYDGGEITLRQLLNHTSGIASHTDDPRFAHDAAGPGFPEHRYDDHAPEDLVALALKQPPHPDPEKNPLYSNTNYVIAGMVIEKATGRTYEREVTRRLIRPLKLRGTSFPGADPRMPKPHPVGYSRLHQEAPDAPVVDATEQNMTWLGAAGDVISTAGDLNRFHRALMRGTLLPRAQMTAMLDEVPVGEGLGYGLGVEFAELSCGVKVVGKSGRTNGSLSAMVGTPDGRRQLTFNVNGDWLPDGSLYVAVIEAEFCGAPAPKGAKLPPGLG